MSARKRKSGQKKTSEGAAPAASPAKEEKKVVQAASPAKEEKKVVQTAPVKQAPAKKGKETPKKEEKKVVEPVEEDEETNDQDNDMEEDEEEEQEKAGGKRKRADTSGSSTNGDSNGQSSEAQPPAKKHKGLPLDPSGQSGSVIVLGLSFRTNSERLRKFFEGVGCKVDHVKVMLDDQRWSKGFAFLDITAGLQSALAQNGAEIDGRHITVNLSDPNRVAGEKAKYIVFVGNLDFAATQEQVEGVMKQFGTVKKVRLSTPKPGEDAGKNNRGFAYVEYETTEEALKAIANTGKVSLLGKELKIDQSTPPEGTPSRSRGRGRGRGARGGRGRGRGRGERGARGRGSS